MLSYDVGIGIGSLLMGCLQETIGLPTGFALTAIAYVIGGIIYIVHVDGYYRPSSEPNSETTLIGANWKIKKAIIATISDATTAISNALRTRRKFLEP